MAHRSNKSNPSLHRHALIVLAAMLLVAVSCGSDQSTEQRDTAERETRETGQAYTPPAELPRPPEPADAPSLEEDPAGTVMELNRGPEGLVADSETGLVAVGLRNPDQLALIDSSSGEVARKVDLPESPRHLGLAAPGGPVLVPVERTNELVQVSLPDGEILNTTPVGKFPHHAAATPNRRIFVLDEQASTISVIENGEVIGTLETLSYPGGVAVTPDGRVGVVGVRGLGLEVFDPESLKSLGRIDAGEGPTHLAAGPDGRFYVADTRGDAILVYEAKPELKQVARLPLDGGSPYGIAMDPERGHLWATLTAENTVVQYDISSDKPEELDRYPTVRQPNTVAVEPESGQVFIGGRVKNQLQILEP
ncbi:MAG: YncE family protein [Rubrobacteraceae bacterium]